MDPNDPRKRLQALQQSNPSIRQQAAPKTVKLYGVDTKVNYAERPMFRSAAQSAEIDSQNKQPEKKTFRGLGLGPEKQKTIFGKNAAWLLPSSLEKTRQVTATGDINDTLDNFLKRFDNTNDDAKRLYVTDLKKQASTDKTAADTLAALEKGGRFKGNLADFAAGVSDRLVGGTGRGILRGADFVLPGKNTLGLERLADQQENPRQYSQAGKIGEVVGTTGKVVTDIGGLFAGSAAGEAAAAKAPGLGNLLEKLSNGGKWSQRAASLVKTIAGSLGGSTASALETAGKGEKQNFGKDVGIGLASDIALGAFGTGLNKLKDARNIKKLINTEDVSVVRSQIAKLLPDADEAAIEDAAKLIAGEKDPEVIKAALDSAAIPKKTPGVVEAAATKTPKAVNSIEDLSKLAKNSFENAPEGVKPGGIERAAAEIDNASAKPIRYRKTPENDIIIENNRHQLEAARKAGINDFPAEDVSKAYGDVPTPKPVSPTEEAQQALSELPKVSGGDVTTAAPESTSVADVVNQNADNATKTVQSSSDILPPDATPEAHQAVQDILDSLNSAETTYKDVTKVRAAEKASRAAQAEQAYQAAGGGEEGMRAKLAALRGKYAESGFSPIDASPENQKAILDDIANSGLRGFEKTNTQQAVRKIWGATDGKPTPSDIKYIRDYFGQEFGDAVEKAVKEAGTSWREKAGQILGLPRSLMASYDLSGTLRQGGILGARFPKQLAEAFKDEVKYFASEDAFKAGMKEIAERPSFEKMVNAGLSVDAAKGLTGTEEQFASNLAEKIPGFGRGIKASDRGYSGFLAKLRADVFDAVVSKEAGKGKDLSEAQLKDIATFINSASGRGDLGKYLEKHSTSLSAALFSPRLWKSRLDQLNPVYYAKLDPVARKYALQSAASFAAAASTVLGLAAMAGAEVETDMRSSDFGKIKVGNTRYDIMGGLQQNIVFAWREISGQKKNATTGEVKSLTDGNAFGADRLSVASDMIQNKENPLLAAGQRVLKGKDRGGNPVNIFSEVANLVTPLGLSGTVETAKDVGSAAKGIAMNVPNVFGVGVQTFGNTKTKDQGKKNAQGFPEYTGKVEPNMVTDKSGKVLLDDKGKPVTVKIPDGASKLEREALIDDKRNTALADQYKRTMSTEDQALLKLSDSQLSDYVKNGKISGDKYKELQSTQQVIKNIAGVKVPDGVRSQSSTDFYKTYNGLNKDQQQEYLDAPADEPAKNIAKDLNTRLPKGLKNFEPTNKLAKAYAEYEKDLGTHDYTDIERNNKTKSFYASAYKGQKPQHVQDMYKEGGSDDLQSFIDNNAITKQDLDEAIALDNELYAAGLAGLKFSKKFRADHGYSVPDGKGGSSSGKAPKEQRAQLAALIPSFKQGPKLPQFSSVSRTSKKLPSKLPKSSGQTKKISIKL